MDTTQLISAAKFDPVVVKSFTSVYAKDKLPKKIKRPACLIFNTDVQSEPGEHWIAIHLTEGGLFTYYDTGGREPICKKFLYENGDKCYYNTRAIQSVTSDACGQHCLYFLHQRCRGNTLQSVVGEFDKKRLQENDQLVTDWVNYKYDLDTEAFRRNKIATQKCKCLWQCKCYLSTFKIPQQYDIAELRL